MRIRCILSTKNSLSTSFRRAVSTATSETSSTSTHGQEVPDDDQFPVYNFKPDQSSGTTSRRGKVRVLVRDEDLIFRYKQMPIDQDWSSVWPVPRSFHPATVPLPIRQGYPKKGQAPPGKFGNAELMKIPNFLHLTPPAIAKQTKVLKQFCTEWPEGLETEEQMTQHFPLEVITSSYCHSGPSVRDPKARIVTMKVKLSSLPLDEHSRDKLLRLVKDRYDKKTDELVLVADRCPTRKQNRDYLEYLLSVLVIESSKHEPWESEKLEEDMEKYIWNRNKSSEVTVSALKAIASSKGLHVEEEEIKKDPAVLAYAEAAEDLHNKGEDDYTLRKYKEAVAKMFSTWSELKPECERNVNAQ